MPLRRRSERSRRVKTNGSGGCSALAEYILGNSELKVGMRLEMLSENQTPLFKGVISKKDDECIWVSHAEGKDVPAVVYNSRVRLRGYRKNDSILLLCGTVFGSSPLFWKIGDISEFSIFNKRESYRHPVAIVTTARRLPHRPGEEPEEETGEDCVAVGTEQCAVVNVSGGGVLFCCDHRFPINANVQLGEIQLYPDRPPFALRCKVLRVSEQDGRYFHGCRFIDLGAKEQERMVQEIFLMQRDEIRRRNSR